MKNKLIMVVIVLLLSIVLVSFDNTSKYDNKIMIDGEYVEIANEALNPLSPVFKLLYKLADKFYSVLGLKNTNVAKDYLYRICSSGGFCDSVGMKKPKSSKTKTIDDQVDEKFDEINEKHQLDFKRINKRTCASEGITDLATCFAFTQIGYVKSMGGAPTTMVKDGVFQLGYALNEGWCNQFVSWAKYLAGEEYNTENTTSASSITNKQSAVVMSNQNGCSHYAIVYYSADGKFSRYKRIDGNWNSKGNGNPNDTGVVLHDVEYYNDNGRLIIGTLTDKMILCGGNTNIDVKYVK